MRVQAVDPGEFCMHVSVIKTEKSRSCHLNLEGGHSTKIKIQLVDLHQFITKQNIS